MNLLRVSRDLSFLDVSDKCNMWAFVTGSLHLACFVDRPQEVDPLISAWAGGRPAPVGECEQCCCEHWFEPVFLSLGCSHLEVEVRGHMVTLSSLWWRHRVAPHSGCTAAPPHQQSTRVPVALHPQQHLPFSVAVVSRQHPSVCELFSGGR